MKTWTLMHIIGVLYLGRLLQFSQIRESFRLLFSFEDPFTHHAFSEGINLFERLRKTGPTPGGLTSGPWFTAFQTAALSRGEGGGARTFNVFTLNISNGLTVASGVHKMADFKQGFFKQPIHDHLLSKKVLRVVEFWYSSILNSFNKIM